jgi:hypothetical protein
MPRPKSGKKNPFDALPKEWKDKIAGFGEQQINDEIAVVAKNEELNRKAKADDVDLKNMQLEVREASAPYRDATKMNRLKTAYLIEMLA